MNIFVNRIHIAKNYIRPTGELKYSCVLHVQIMLKYDVLYKKDLISLALFFFFTLFLS